MDWYKQNPFIHLILQLIILTKHGLVHLSACIILDSSYFGTKKPLSIFIEETHYNINLFIYRYNSLSLNHIITGGIIYPIQCCWIRVEWYWLHVAHNFLSFIDIFSHACYLTIGWFWGYKWLYLYFPEYQNSKKSMIINDTEIFLLLTLARSAYWWNSRNVLVLWSSTWFPLHVSLVTFDP